MTLKQLLRLALFNRKYCDVYEECGFWYDKANQAHRLSMEAANRKDYAAFATHHAQHKLLVRRHREAMKRLRKVA